MGVRGQRFAYCYGDCGGQPQPAGSELSVTWAGGPALGSARGERPGGGRDARRRGAASPLPLRPGPRGLAEVLPAAGGELASLARLGSLSAGENHILKIVIIYNR